MREVQEGMISCQLAYYPMGDAQYLQQIDTVIALIEASSVWYEIREGSSILKGAPSDIFALLQKIVEIKKGNAFVINATISNVCGCEIE